MFKKIAIASVITWFILGVTSLSFAMDCGEMAHHVLAQLTGDKEHPSPAVNVGNKICPVTGERIDEAAKVTYEYQGKIYNFCCAACPEEFKKDPDKYIKKIEEEKKETNNSQEEPVEVEHQHSH